MKPIDALRPPLIIAHRGDSARAPENTLIAFQRAVASGADGVEFDVRLAADGVPVVFHDPSLDRIAGVKGKVAEFTSEELRRLDAGSWFNRRRPRHAEEAFVGEGIPTLAETLGSLGGYGGLVYVELKCREQDVERLTAAVCDAVNGSPLLPRVVVKSFKLRALSRSKDLLPGIRTAALFAPKIRNILRTNKHMLSLAEAARADEISVHYTLATRKLTGEARRRGLEVVIWTADNVRWVARGTDLGLKAIITNAPAKLLAERDMLISR